MPAQHRFQDVGRFERSKSKMQRWTKPLSRYPLRPRGGGSSCFAGSAKLTSEAIRLVLRLKQNQELTDAYGLPTAATHDRRHADA